MIDGLAMPSTRLAAVESLNNLELKTFAAYSQSEFFATDRDFDMSLQWLNSSEEWCRQPGYLRGLAWCMCRREGILLQEGKAVESEAHLVESLMMAVSWHERGLIAYNEQRLAQVYFTKGQGQLSLRLAREAAIFMNDW